MFAESARLKKHVTTLLIQDGVLQYRAPKPRVFIWIFRVQHEPGFNLGHGIEYSGITKEDFESVTVADFPESVIPRILKQLGWTPERLFAAYREHGRIIAEYHEAVRENKDAEMLATLLEGLPAVTEVRLCGWHDDARKKFVNTPSVNIRILQPNILEYGGGRALDRFLRAAAATKTAIPNLSTLVLGDEDFFHRADIFSTLDPSVVTASLPALQTLTSLALPLVTCQRFLAQGPSSRGPYDSGRQDTDLLLICGLPKLRHLRIYAKEHKGPSPVELSPIMDAISSSHLSSIDLEFCSFTLPSMENFLRRHSGTLKTMRLNRVILIQAHFETMFTLIRDVAQLDEMVISGTLVEKSTPKVSHYPAGCLASEAAGIKARQDAARREIARFAIGKRKDFPRELLDVDSMEIDDIYRTEYSFRGGFQNCVCVIGENFVSRTSEERRRILAEKMEMYTDEELGEADLDSEYEFF